MNKKKILRILTALLALAVVAGGATLALLNTTTNTATNVFTSDKKINIALREPLWDGFTFDDSLPANPGEVAKDPSNSTLGINKATNYVPGSIIPKNPMVSNPQDANGVDTYVAIRVRYFIKDQQGNDQFVTYDTFKNQIGSIDFSNQQWTAIQMGTNDKPEDVYLYGTGETNPTVLSVGNVTQPLFNNVTINKNIAVDPETATLPEFKIQVQAFGVQSANVGGAEAQTELLKLANSIQ